MDGCSSAVDDQVAAKRGADKSIICTEYGHFHVAVPNLERPYAWKGFADSCRDDVIVGPAPIVIEVERRPRGVMRKE
jgi:hypothetical protein